MAKRAKKPTMKQTKAIARVAVTLLMESSVPDCQYLFAAADAIQQLIAENCSIAQPNVPEVTRSKRGS